MRPAGEVREAVLKAVAELTTEDQAPTVRELAEKSKVGYTATLETVRNLNRANLIHIPRRRKVAYRNCPVAEYAPVSYTHLTLPTTPYV